MPPVFVDGEIRAVLAYGELPPTFEPTVIDRDGSDYSLCNLARFLETLGVDFSLVKAVHFEGAGRTAAITGDVLRDRREDLFFTFQRSRGTRRRPMMEWPAKKIISTTRIDRLIGMHVFITKVPPIWNRKTRKFHFKDGSALEGVAYAEDFTPIRAARLYVDGNISSYFSDATMPKDAERKQGDGTGSGKGGKGKGGKGKGGKGKGGSGKGGSGKGKGDTDGGVSVSLASYIRHQGIDLAEVNAVEIIGEDRVLGRYDKEAWNKAAETLTFRIPKKNKKQLVMDLGADATTFPGLVKVQAVALYMKTKPTERTITEARHRPKASK